MTLDELLSIDESLIVPVAIASGTVHLCRLSAARRDAFDRALPDDPQDKDRKDTNCWRARVTALCLCDEAGVEQIKDMAAVLAYGDQWANRRGTAPTIAKLFEQAKILAGFVTDDEKN